MSDFRSDPLDKTLALREMIFALREMTDLDRHVEGLCERRAKTLWGPLGPVRLSREWRLYESGVVPLDELQKKAFPDPPPPFVRMPEELYLRFKNSRPSEPFNAAAFARSCEAFRQAEKAMPRRDAVDKIAGELGRTPRQVQRYIAQLIQAGKAPAAWFDGYQYKPDPREAAALIRQEVANCARRPKRKAPPADSFDALLLQLHAKRERAWARLRKHEEKYEQIELGLLLFRAAYHQQWLNRYRYALLHFDPETFDESPDRLDFERCDENKERFEPEAAEMARGLIKESRFGMKGWMLQICFYHARAHESTHPVEHVCQLLGVSPSTFWRRFGHDPSLMRAARDGGDAYFNFFATGRSPAQMMDFKPAARVLDNETSDAESLSAWDEQLYVASAVRTRSS